MQSDLWIAVWMLNASSKMQTQMKHLLTHIKSIELYNDG